MTSELDGLFQTKRCLTGFAHSRVEVDQGSRAVAERYPGNIARDNPVAAGKVVAGIYNKVQLLREFPELGQKYRSEPEGDIRVVLYGHYRIVYLIRTENLIDILGVFHGALDIERYFT